MKALVISPVPELREQLRVALRSAERRSGERWEYLEAPDGIEGLRVAWRELPDVVVADQIASGAGGFAVAKDLRGQQQPFAGVIVIMLARPHDAWLARWAGADAWLDRRVDPFTLAETVTSLIERRTVTT